ncbi:MAG TPA: MFS transporter [Candidatus Binatia bacterium]|jgi:ACS family tartrate transporter-like MFS transporter
MTAVNPARVMRKVVRRLIPFLFICYIINYIDRINVGYAALEMKADLGFSDAVYGLGASMFFVGYVLFEIPSNLIMERVGARLWIARIMISWGVVSSSMMFVKTAEMFYILRFLLGAAEAGFFPGTILYLTHWVPAKERARAVALFLTSTALSGVIGGPLSGLLLNLGGVGGLAGWQWLFVIEGIPAMLLGFVTLAYLTDHPDQARWLAPEERDWLGATMRAEQEEKRQRHSHTLATALVDRKVWGLCLLYFSIIISFYGVVFWLPQIVKNFSGMSNLMVGMVSAVPYLIAAIAMVLIGNHSDKTGERRRHVALPALAGSIGLILSALLQGYSPPLAFLALCLAALGIWSTLGPFWSLPTEFLSGTAAAGGIALINSIGNVGGFVGPFVVGYVKQATGEFTGGLLCLAVTLLAGSCLALKLAGGREPGG